MQVGRVCITETSDCHHPLSASLCVGRSRLDQLQVGKKLMVFKVLSERDCLTDDSRLEHKANRLWIPEDSSFNLNKVNITSNNYGASRHWLMMLNHVSQHLYSYILQAWLDQHFPTKIRTQTVLIKTENVLTPQSVQLVKLLRRFSDERL